MVNLIEQLFKYEQLLNRGAMRNDQRERLLVKTARLYYEQQLTQSEIGDRLRLSRQRVQRLLKEAHRSGVVQILIRPVMDGFDILETRLEGMFSLREAVVVETTEYENYEIVTREIGIGAAGYLMRVLQPQDSITLSWGGSLLGMVNALEGKVRFQDATAVTVIQSLGGLGDPTNEVHAADLTRRLAKLLGGEAVLLPAPGIAGTEAAGRILREDPNVKTALSRAAGANLAFMGIGAPRPDSILIQKGTIVQWEELAGLQALGAVGDINLRYFDAAGRRVESELDRRVIGLSLDQIRNIDTIVAVAGGAAKYEAIRSALAGSLVDVLITDHRTAGRLIAEAN